MKTDISHLPFERPSRCINTPLGDIQTGIHGEHGRFYTPRRAIQASVQNHRKDSSLGHQILQTFSSHTFVRVWGETSKAQMGLAAHTQFYLLECLSVHVAT